MFWSILPQPCIRTTRNHHPKSCISTLLELWYNVRQKIENWQEETMNMILKFQAIICAAVILAGFIASFYLETDIFYNLAWALTGLMFFINPVYPKSITCLEEKSYTGNAHSSSYYNIDWIHTWFWRIRIHSQLIPLQGAAHHNFWQSKIRYIICLYFVSHVKIAYIL